MKNFIVGFVGTLLLAPMFAGAATVQERVDQKVQERLSFEPTDLFDAVYRADIPAVKDLMARGLDVTQVRDEQGRNALMLLVQNSVRLKVSAQEQVAMAQFLLKQGMPINQVSKTGASALMLGLMARADFGLLKLLLSFEPKVSGITDNQGRTALTLAVDHFFVAHYERVNEKQALEILSMVQQREQQENKQLRSHR